MKQSVGRAVEPIINKSPMFYMKLIFVERQVGSMRKSGVGEACDNKQRSVYDSNYVCVCWQVWGQVKWTNVLHLAR